MPFEFFVNYSRANNDAYLQRFVGDLDGYVRERRGLGPKDAVSFFDQQDIELGADWDLTIASALAETRVVVCIASPAIFKSEYCGRERALFRRRFAGRDPAPPLIKPIVWVPFTDVELPQKFSAEQFTFGDPAAIHNTKGVKYLLRQIQRYQVEYNDLIVEVGEQLIADAATHKLTKLTPIPRLASIQSDWGVAGSTPLAMTTGPKHVRFVYFALDPNSIGNGRSVEAYRDTGGVEWKPFYPDPTPIHLFAQQVVTSDALAFTSDAVDFGDDLLDQIGRAWDARQIVVLVIDAWSLQWDAERLQRGYQTLLSRLDTQNAFHWCVLIPWNEKDAELSANRRAIEEVIGATFPFHGRLTKNPMFYRDDIKSFPELKTALTEVLARLREEIRRQAQVTRSLPVGPSKP